jgi:GDPmannose 4,6-dehydratase
MKKALITGITGQDGSYLAELLLEKGYDVHGLVRRSASEDYRGSFARIGQIIDRITLHHGSVENHSRMLQVIHRVRPDECYHLAAQSFVHLSFEDAFTTLSTNINGTHHLLTALQEVAPNCRFYFAATSEMFGNTPEMPQRETTPFAPRSPYGISKLTGYELTRNFREAYGMFALSGILFNHESPRRGVSFLTRKVTRTLGAIRRGETNMLVVGNMEAKRDWGFAGDYVRAMYLMLQQEAPEDFVVATGEAHSVREFIDEAFNAAGMEYTLIDLSMMDEDRADRECARLEASKDRVFLVQHPRFYRPAEVDHLLGDASKAREKLGWKPEVSFKELVRMMVERDRG